MYKCGMQTVVGLNVQVAILTVTRVISKMFVFRTVYSSILTRETTFVTS